MAFDPDAFLAEDNAFDPDAFLADESQILEPELPTREPEIKLREPEDFGLADLTVPGLLMRANDYLNPPREGEANTAEAIGRGMMDVYQGGQQLAINWADRINKYDRIADETFAPGSFANKAHKSILGAMASLVPEVDANAYNKQVSQELKLYNSNNPDFQGSRVLGSVATPLTLVPGSRAVTFGGKLITGVGSGTVFSLFQPVTASENPDEFFAEKAEQAMWGAGFGAGIPVGGKILSSIGGWLEELSRPFTKGGIERDVTDFLKKYVTQNKAKITAAIDKAIKEKDTRSVGQIIADTVKGTGDDFGGMLVKLEQDISKRSDVLKSLYARQDLKRTRFLDTLAGTSDDLVNAVNNRASNGTKNYAAAFDIDVIPDEELGQILNNKFAKIAMNKAKEIGEVNGARSQTELLHWVKLDLDRQLAKNVTEPISKAQMDAIGSVKSKLVSWLGKKNPAYEKARAQYELDSLPINRLTVGQALKSSFMGALGENKASVFAKAVQEAPKTIKKATGFPRYDKLDDVLLPDEVKMLNKIVDDLSVEKKAASMAQKSAGILSKLSTEMEFRLPRILSRPVVITNHILEKMGHDKSPQYMELLGMAASNPDEFIRIWGGPAKNEGTKMAMDIVRRLNTMIASQQSAQTAGATTVIEE